MILRNVGRNVPFKADITADLSTLTLSVKNVSSRRMIQSVFHLDFNKTEISLSVKEEDAILVLVIMMESRVRREKNNLTNITIHNMNCLT